MHQQPVWNGQKNLENYFLVLNRTINKMTTKLTWPQCRSLPGGKRLKRFTNKTQALQISPLRGVLNWKHSMKSVSYFFESVKRELKWKHTVSEQPCNKLRLKQKWITCSIWLYRYNNPVLIGKLLVCEMKTLSKIVVTSQMKWFSSYKAARVNT